MNFNIISIHAIVSEFLNHPRLQSKSKIDIWKLIKKENQTLKLLDTTLYNYKLKPKIKQATKKSIHILFTLI